MHQHHYLFLTLPGYACMEVTSAIEVLRLCNRIRRQECYRWTIISLDGRNVPASNGMTLCGTVALNDAGPADAVWVCSGNEVQAQICAQLMNVMRHCAKLYPLMGGIGTGAYVLAAAGLLVGYKAAIHWEHRFSASELFTRGVFSDGLYVVDRNRCTAAGGSAPMHLMLQLVRTYQGEAIAIAVSEHLNLERIRDYQDKQYSPMQSRVGLFQATLLEIGELMQANIEEPLSIKQISAQVGISLRQMERLFKRYVGEMPTKYYMDLRLQQARALIVQTTMPIWQIARACGFANSQYFSRCYREKFGYSPRGDRTSAGRNIDPEDAEGGMEALLRKGANFASASFDG